MIVGMIFGGFLSLLWGFDLLRLRGRARALVKLGRSDAPISDDLVFFARPGVVLSEEVKRAASDYVVREGLQALELVPANVACWRVGLLLSALDPRRYRADRFAPGATVGDALVVDAKLLARVRESTEYPGEPTDAVSLAKLARVLKRYACQSSDVVVIDPVASPAIGLGDRRQFVFDQYGEMAVFVQTALYGMLITSLITAPAWGLAATLILHLQFLLVTLGSPLSPRDLASYTLFRSLIEFASLFGSKRGTDTESLRGVYERLLANGTAPFFEPPREDCLVCGARSLRTVFAIGDHYQFKPGRFELSECTACGHRFQNPRLSVEGLNFYYRDFYDGIGRDRIEGIFASDTKPYLNRARMVAAATSSRRWLDVGAGHGHFCNIARDVMPETVFDGLDLADAITDAERRGWVKRGIRGLFPEMAPKIEASGELYDVVSMSHYLEHTIDPRAEIAAAAKVLQPGGFLMIEVPDPECKFGRLLGRHWMPWFQPQHLNFLSLQNLERLLTERGFSTVARHRGEAHLPTDFALVFYLLMNRLAPPTDLPWRARSGTAASLWHRFVWMFACPLLILAILFDHLITPLTRRPGWSNAYRILAKAPNRSAT